jgi:hypothetical protein
MFMLPVSVLEVMNDAKTNINNVKSVRMNGILCFPVYVDEAILPPLTHSRYKCQKYQYLMSVYENCFIKVQ